MKKILFISSRPIFPIIGGDQIRTAQQLEFLSQRYIVDVIYFNEKNITQNNNTINIPNIGKLICFRISKFKCLLQTLRFLINKLPLQVNYYYNNRVQKYISTHIKDYDAVFCNNIRTAEYVVNFQHIIKYIDFVDAISMNYEKAKQHATGIKKWIYTIDHKRCRYYEQRIMHKFDSCAIISEIDKQYIQCGQKKSISLEMP